MFWPRRRDSAGGTLPSVSWLSLPSEKDDALAENLRRSAAAAEPLEAAFVLCVEGFNDTHAFTPEAPSAPPLTSSLAARDAVAKSPAEASSAAAAAAEAEGVDDRSVSFSIVCNGSRQATPLQWAVSEGGVLAESEGALFVFHVVRSTPDVLIALTSTQRRGRAKPLLQRGVQRERDLGTPGVEVASARGFRCGFYRQRSVASRVVRWIQSRHFAGEPKFVFCQRIVSWRGIRRRVA